MTFKISHSTILGAKATRTILPEVIRVEHSLVQNKQHTTDLIIQSTWIYFPQFPTHTSFYFEGDAVSLGKCDRSFRQGKKQSVFL